MTADRHAAFRALFETHFDALLIYARRRTAERADAEDAVAEVFVVVWRRWEDLPCESERLPWLYGVARRVLANQRRGARRRVHLVDRIRSAFVKADAGAGPAGDVTSALRCLSAPDQEILRLVAWEGLNHREASIALGVSPNAVALRLYRARRRLRAAMDGSVKEPAPSRTSARWKGHAAPGRSREETQ